MHMPSEYLLFQCSLSSPALQQATAPVRSLPCSFHASYCSKPVIIKGHSKLDGWRPMGLCKHEPGSCR